MEYFIASYNYETGHFYILCYNASYFLPNMHELWQIDSTQLLQGVMGPHAGVTFQTGISCVTIQSNFTILMFLNLKLSSVVVESSQVAELELADVSQSISAKGFFVILKIITGRFL